MGPKVEREVAEAFALVATSGLAFVATSGPAAVGSELGQEVADAVAPVATFGMAFLATSGFASRNLLVLSEVEVRHSAKVRPKMAEVRKASE